jgi:hypothetical protein
VGGFFNNPGEHLIDYSLAILTVIATQLPHHIPETLACVLVSVRIIVGIQEYRINRRKLDGKT